MNVDNTMFGFYVNEQFDGGIRFRRSARFTYLYVKAQKSPL
ncbi:hypothetical protein VCHA53O466_40451 [Vibrio chagasii]|nr:hypothetical protein VCHA53O466_40451 [Vibrio chagasii]